MLDRLDAGCLLARLESCDGIAGAEDAVLHHAVLTKPFLLTDSSCLLLNLFCCHLFVV